MVWCKIMIIMFFYLDLYSKLIGFVLSFHQHNIDLVGVKTYFSCNHPRRRVSREKGLLLLLCWTQHLQMCYHQDKLSLPALLVHTRCSHGTPSVDYTQQTYMAVVVVCCVL